MLIVVAMLEMIENSTMRYVEAYLDLEDGVRMGENSITENSITKNSITMIKVEEMTLRYILTLRTVLGWGRIRESSPDSLPCPTSQVLKLSNIFSIQV